MKDIFIYSLVVKRSGEVIYVGQSGNVGVRVGQHGRKMKEYGGRGGVGCCVLEVTNEWKADERELHWIAEYVKAGQAKLNVQRDVAFKVGDLVLLPIEGGDWRSKRVMRALCEVVRLKARYGRTDLWVVPVSGDGELRVSSGSVELSAQLISDNHKRATTN